MDNQSTKKIRKMSGVVVSAKMDKTIVVKVEQKKAHPLYGKRLTVAKRYKVHDEDNKYKVGDVVEFKETRPYSKDKKWIVLNKQ